MTQAVIASRLMVRRRKCLIFIDGEREVDNREVVMFVVLRIPNSGVARLGNLAVDSRSKRGVSIC